MFDFFYRVELNSIHKRLLIMFVTLAIVAGSNELAAQTVKTYIDNQWPDERYSDLADGTVVDNRTGLMWKKCSEGLSGSSCATGSATTHTWQGALNLAQQATDAGYNDWRLPNIKELASLAAHDRYNPAINSVVFPNTQSSGYWSSSPYAYYSGNAWLLYFSSGYDYGGYRNLNYYVRLVRGGQ